MKGGSNQQANIKPSDETKHFKKLYKQSKKNDSLRKNINLYDEEANKIKEKYTNALTLLNNDYYKKKNELLGKKSSAELNYNALNKQYSESIKKADKREEENKRKQSLY
jgi:hypothetical protein